MLEKENGKETIRVVEKERHRGVGACLYGFAETPVKRGVVHPRDQRRESRVPFGESSQRERMSSNTSLALAMSC